MPASPFLAANAIFSENQRFSVNGQLAEIGSAWQAGAPSGLGITLNEAVNALQATQVSLGLGALCSDSVTIDTIVAYLLDPITGLATHIGSSSAGTSMGGETPGLVPTQAAAIIQKITGLPGRRYRGRWYWPFLLKNMIGPTGELTGGAKTNFLFYVSQYLAPHTVTGASGTQTINPVILHRDPLPLTVTGIESWIVSGKIGTQKRRGDYGRLNLVSA